MYFAAAEGAVMSPVAERINEMISSANGISDLLS